MELRPSDPADLAALERLAAACWPDDATMRQLHTVGGHTTHAMLALDAHDVVGAASLDEGRFHPTRAEIVVIVDPAHRRRGIATTLLNALRDRTERPLLARTRSDEEGGLGFLRAKGFRPIMRNRVAVIDSTSTLTVNAHGLDIRSVDLSIEQAARALERQYRAEHAAWAPTGEWALDESIQVFCGPFWVVESTVGAYRNGELVGIGALYGEPIADGPDELYLSHIGPFDLDDPDAERIARSIFARELAFARERGVRLRVEVDQANAPIWSLVEELTAIETQDLVLLATN